MHQPPMVVMSSMMMMLLTVVTQEPTTAERYVGGNVCVQTNGLVVVMPSS